MLCIFAISMAKKVKMATILIQTAPLLVKTAPISITSPNTSETIKSKLK